ncbi:hypothetical protein [Cognatishimia sp. F0-27]|uniref:hypothetical protein n=1 Tax=Cognatishimia sp. F0-27 TaxID=2816855 RepID=UPI001D0C21F0|nr:hypothetical protein [Cognatishimia sp. F0-27]MCC1492242.1 hypothetical protein [Cognatishimia sp. F0-27]
MQDQTRRKATTTIPRSGTPAGRAAFGPFIPQPDEVFDALSPRDIRGQQTTSGDQSRHRRYQWLYEDLIS